MVISKAPKRLNPKAMKRIEMKALTHRFDPNCTIPKGPSAAVMSSPIPENSTMIPRQKTIAWVTLSRRPDDSRFRK